MHEERARHMDGLLRVVHRHVDVKAEESATRDVLQLVDEVSVAIAGGDALALEEAERVVPAEPTRGPGRGRSPSRSSAAA